VPNDGSVLVQQLRANQAYEFVPFSRISARHRRLLARLKKDPEFCGVLRPRGNSTLGVKSATRAVAALFKARRTAGLLPVSVASSAGSSLEAEITRLVLDGVLEVRHENRFVCGAAASHLLPLSVESPKDAVDAIASLSLDALRYAEALDIDDSEFLSARIYFYNRVPMSPRWSHRVASPEATANFLGISKGSPTARLLDQHWIPGKAEPVPNWLSWIPRERSAGVHRDAPTFKLYVSPAPDALSETVSVLVRTLSEAGPAHFKIGADLHGLLRPDKIVLYFNDPATLEDIARLLLAGLRGIPAHGVPFTRSIDAQGLLSCGVDPPRRLKLFSWRETESWRLWITNRLAVYILTARATRDRHTKCTNAEFALARIRIEGVDTNTWSPADTLWPSPHAAER
jgi:hypothetical protein